VSPGNGRERILVVDDAPEALEMLRKNLASQGFEVLTAPGVSEAMMILDETPVDLVITDLRMHPASGLDLVRHVDENLEDTEVIMITGHATIVRAVEAVKAAPDEHAGAPLGDRELLSSVRHALERLRTRKAARPSASRAPHEHYGLIGDSSTMQPVYGAIAKASGTTATVLVSGEGHRQGVGGQSHSLQ
jgi:DNA-binding NtrC family response regulator